MNIQVKALEGSGIYHLSATIVKTHDLPTILQLISVISTRSDADRGSFQIGTTERLSREAILNRAVFLEVDCANFADCTHRYAGLEMRADDGSSFPLRFTPTTGLSYNFTATLRDGSSAAHLHFAIYPPESIVR